MPGVSAATAVPAYAGVPLTPAGPPAVHVVHPRRRRGGLERARRPGATVVVLGPEDDVLAAASGPARGGPQAGDPGRGDLATAPRSASARCPAGWTRSSRRCRRPGLERPLLAVVGAAAGLRDRASWFETKPLFGWRVLVPRTKQQAGAMVARLAEHGALSEVVPTISVEPPRTPHQMEKAVKGLVTGRYEWIGFTSVNAVRAMREKFEEFGLDARAFAGLKVAAVGGVTAAALREWGIEPDLVPTGNEQSADGLLEVWPPFDEVLDPINRVFLPRADIATDTLVAGLQAERLGGRRRDRLPDGAGRPAAGRGPRGDQDRAVRRGRLHLLLHRPQPGRDRREAARHHGRGLHRPGDREDRRGARAAGRRPGAASRARRRWSEALAEYGAGLRLSAVEAGEPVLRPSQRKGAARRTAK